MEKINSLTGMLDLISSKSDQNEFANKIFSSNKKKKEFINSFQVLDPEDISNALLFALNTKWKTNISLIEILPTEQSPGGIPIIPVKDPILE